jgi:hypothetical protein
MTAFAAILLSIAPASAQTVTVSAAIANYGPVTACPATVKFVGTISASGWPASATRELHVKWTRSDGTISPAQTLNFPEGSSMQTVTTTWTLGANGINWEAVQASGIPPSSTTMMRVYTSNHATFNLTCPTPTGIPGSLKPAEKLR